MNRNIISKKNEMEILNIFEFTINFLHDYEPNNISESFNIINFLGEVYRFETHLEKIDNILIKNINLINYMIPKCHNQIGIGMFGGWSDLGFAVEIMNKNSGMYDKFTKSLRKIILQKSNVFISKINSDLETNNVKTNDFDTINGVSGLLAYLLYTKDPAMNNIIKEINQYLSNLVLERHPLDKEISVYNWYIERKNLTKYELSDKTFNGGLYDFSPSHGISGPLMGLAKSIKNNHYVENSEEAIKTILEVLKQNSYYADNNCLYFPGKLDGKLLLSPKNENHQISRMSWCYGSLSILRIMKKAATVINDTETILMCKTEIEKVSQLPLTDTLLHSATFCHGWAGHLNILLTEYYEENYIDTNVINNLVDIILIQFSKDNKFGFKNIEYDWDSNALVHSDELSLISGTLGVVLSLMDTIKPTELNKKFLIN